MRKIIPFELKAARGKSVVVAGLCVGKGVSKPCDSEIDSPLFLEKMYIPVFHALCNEAPVVEVHVRALKYWESVSKVNPNEVNQMLFVEATKALGALSSGSCLERNVGCRLESF